MLKKKVLLVEDTFDNRAIYEMVLDHAGYQVIVAENGALGVQAARAHHPDLILMDLSMPVMDGWEALRVLKADPQLMGIPVCALTAHVLHEGDLERALEAGFTDYLTKPVRPTEVLAKVLTQIGSAA
jgi:CheY-like chemotaxis protein